MFNGLNQLKGRFRFKVPFDLLIDSYYRAVATRSVLISFEENLWGIALSYSKRSCLFTGHLNKKTKNSGTMGDFVKRFVPTDSNVRLFIQEIIYDNLIKEGQLM